MKPTERATTMSAAALKPALQAHLFPELPDGALNTFAVLDGAAIPHLIDHLYGDPRPDFVCLYRGALEPDMAEVAPYLVQLKLEAPFTEWVLTEGWGKHWGIFVLSAAPMVAVRRHFRTFLMVKNPEGKQLYFRFYDPRVLRVFLPTCNRQETAAVFGPLKAYLCEADKPETLLTFGIANGLPKFESARLAWPG